MYRLPEEYDLPFQPALYYRFVKKQAYRKTVDLIGQHRWGTTTLIFDQSVEMFCEYIDGQIKYYKNIFQECPSDVMTIREHTINNDREMAYLNEDNFHYEKLVLEYLVGVKVNE